jgi:hypothetical protein
LTFGVQLAMAIVKEKPLEVENGAGKEFEK